MRLRNYLKVGVSAISFSTRETAKKGLLSECISCYKNKTSFISLSDQGLPKQFFSSQSSKSQNSILQQMELDEFKVPHNYKHCEGCGAKFQMEDPSKFGYIEKSVLKGIVEHNKEIANRVDNGVIKVKRGGVINDSDILSQYMIEQNRLNDLKNKRNNLFIEINDLELLQAVDSQIPTQISSGFKQKRAFENTKYENGIKKPICLRCHQLKYQSNHVQQSISSDITGKGVSSTSNDNDRKKDLSDNTKNISSSNSVLSTTSKNEDQKRISEEAENNEDDDETFFDDGQLVSQHDSKAFLRSCFAKVKKNSTVLLVVDASDLMGTLNLGILEEAFSRNHKAIIVINKVDTLPPKSVQVNLIKHVVKKTISERFKDQLPQLEEIFLVSSKNGEGIERIAQYIVAAKEEARQYQHSRYSKYFYVMGYTNTGKSSLINALNKSVNRHLKKAKNTSVSSDNNSKDGELNAQDKKMVRKLLHGGEEQDDSEETIELTTSNVPGTTVGFVKCKNSRLNVNVYDTPGMNSDHQMSSQFQDKAMGGVLVINKRIAPKAFHLTNGLSVFFGGLCRVDFVNGLNIDAVVFATSDLALHVTKTLKANSVFIQHYNSLLVPVLHPDFAMVQFKQYTVELQFNHLGKPINDLHIFGLGWVSFSAPANKAGSTTVSLYLPEKVGFALAPSFYRIDQHLLDNKYRTRSPHSRVIERQKKTNIFKAAQIQ